MSSSSRIDVVTAFLLNENDRILLLQRSQSVKTYKGRWAAVSGYLETCDPLLQAEREIREETGLTEKTTLCIKGRPVVVDDRENHNFWRVHPFRFRYSGVNSSITLNREHEDHKWISPNELPNYETVPKLPDAWRRVQL